MIVSAPPPLVGLADRLAARVPLGSQEREALLELPAASARRAGNRPILAADVAPGHAYLVVEGLVARIQSTRRGEQQITALYLPGEIACAGLIRSAPVGALHTIAPSAILVVPHEALRRAQQRHPALARALWAECLLESGIAAEWLLNIGRRRALARTAHLFCELACRHAGSDRGPRLRFALPARQNHLADMLALTTVHLNRTLRVLRETRLATCHERELIIHDWPRLASLGDFDARYLT
jgi:CRP-like cAMP-binding protein